MRARVDAGSSVRDLVPEGPTLVILRDLAQPFAGERVRKATCNAKIDRARLTGQRIVALRTWGKHFLIEFRGFSIRIHFLMFGRWCINERRNIEPRLSLTFTRERELNFYNCAVRYIEGARRPGTLPWRAASCAGCRTSSSAMRCCPLSKVGALPAQTLRAVVDQARLYSFEFLEWKKAFVLRQHWLVHNKGVCPRCNGRLTRAYLGTRQRRTFFCAHCQKRARASKSAAHKRASAAANQRLAR